MRPGLRIQLIVDPALLALAVDDMQRALQAVNVLIEIEERSKTHHAEGERLRKLVHFTEEPAGLSAIANALRATYPLLQNGHELERIAGELTKAIEQSRSLAEVPVMLPIDRLPLGEPAEKPDCPATEDADLPY